MRQQIWKKNSKKVSWGGAHRGDGKMVAIWRGPVISSDSEQSNGAEEDGVVIGALGTVGSLQGGKRDEERRRWLLCTNALRTTWREERNRGLG
jgi:hypothetical protein